MPISVRAEEIANLESLPAETQETTAPSTETTQPPVQITQPTSPPEETTQPTTPPEETTLPTTLPEETTQPTTPPEETTQPTSPPEETTEPTISPEETTPPTQPPENTVPLALPTEPAVTPIPIAQAASLPAGTTGIVIRGTVVYASGKQAVLQDDTGGIRLLFDYDSGAVQGEILQITGRRSGGFVVEDFESLGMGTLPAMETSLLEAPENVRVHITGATLSYQQLVQNGFSLSLIASLPESVAESEFVEAYGVILDGRFYADTVFPQSAPMVPALDEDDAMQEWNFYFGQLHAHTSISDGQGTVQEVFRRASETDNLDFFAVTDHSDSFDNAVFGDITGDGGSVDWRIGKEAAKAVTNDNFLGIFGYEMSWPSGKGLGHIATFNTPGWQCWTQPAMDSLTAYYDKLVQVKDSISQFNHPGHVYGNFHFFDYHSPRYDSVIHLVEVGGREDPQPFDYYVQALDAGWHLGPSNNQNGQQSNWTQAGTVRTVVLANQLTEEAVFDAIRNHRVYATEDCDLEIQFQVNGAIMGSILPQNDLLTFQVYVNDPTDASIGTVEVVTEGGEEVQKLTVTESSDLLEFTLPREHGYYFLRITQPDGDKAVTAPIWVDSYEDAGIQSFQPDVANPMEEQPVSLNLKLYNHEDQDFAIARLEFWQDSQLLHTMDNPGTVSPLGELPYTLPFLWEEPGEVQITVKVTGFIAGYPISREAVLTLRYQAKNTQFVTIAQARAGTVGAAYHIKGYVTAGNQNYYNTFPNTLYVQDDTGGIALMGDAGENIPVGAPMEATGVLRKTDGNLMLELIEAEVLQETYYRYVPRTMTHEVAMDYAVHGGELLQVEGTVVSLLKTTDGKGISRMTLKDIRGDLATVVIEDDITSGAYGTNELAAQIKKGRTVRAMGILHKDEFGETVLRVRNCDEVMYVPPKADPTNPKTGDGWMMKFVS